MDNNVCNVDLTTDCWICGKPMKIFAQDSWYWFLKCVDCKTEKLIPKERELKDNA